MEPRNVNPGKGNEPEMRSGDRQEENKKPWGEQKKQDQKGLQDADKEDLTGNTSEAYEDHSVDRLNDAGEEEGPVEGDDDYSTEDIDIEEGDEDRR